MKKLYKILSLLLLAAIFAVGAVSVFDTDATYSESERRKLKTAPALTVSALLDGSFFSDFSAYFADTFPGREILMDTNRSLNGFYYFVGNGSLILDFTSNGADKGEALTENVPQETVPDETQPPQEEHGPEQLGSILLVGDSAFDIPYANYAKIPEYAAAVNAIAETLGSSVETYWMPVPNSAEFYTPEAYHTGANSQQAIFDLCREQLDSGITYVDAYSILKSHQDEYLYFRTDHHWTHLGAYYAYNAFGAAAGFIADPISDFRQGQWEGFVGSMYTYASNYPQAQVLKENPDTVEYWQPHVECSTKYYSSTALSDPMPSGTICRIDEDVSNKYLTFMGGDHPVTVVETQTEGPVILVIKESYGNPLISWLTGHYSKIILIDPREYFALNSGIDLASFAEEQGVSQCLIVNYPMMLGSAGYISHLTNLSK
ncbi:MAG: hypothetical protein IKY17_06600 [Oscillospiraceae bacterium]|nr:hypothetical protein [Oscillospiraceae bacterium]